MTIDWGSVFAQAILEVGLDLESPIQTHQGYYHSDNDKNDADLRGIA
jgi:hypothetical protein